MKKLFLVILISLAPLVSAKEKGWVTLYNGKDLTGWQTTGNWLPQKDGSVLIQPRKGEKGWQRYKAYLWTKRTYKDFVLHVEYKYPPKGNSGIYFRVRDRDNPVKTGIEAQVLDSFGKKKVGPHDHGGIISTVGAIQEHVQETRRMEHHDRDLQRVPFAGETERRTDRRHSTG